MLRGAFPEVCRRGRTSLLPSLYEAILQRDVLLARGVRDQATLARVALLLLASTAEGVTANAIRNTLKIKAVTTVTEHMDHLERAGLVSFVPILSGSVGTRQVVGRAHV